MRLRSAINRTRQLPTNEFRCSHGYSNTTAEPRCEHGQEEIGKRAAAVFLSNSHYALPKAHDHTETTSALRSLTAVNTGTESGKQLRAASETRGHQTLLTAGRITERMTSAGRIIVLLNACKPALKAQMRTSRAWYVLTNKFKYRRRA